MANFQTLKKTRLEELKADLIEGVHVASGARFMHIANDDPENLFCLSFKTYPETSNGVAHILEHIVLCGSEKFPVKDPFFAMTRRSLHTFMNALTGSDFTCYPAATQIEKDFYNLLDVYLDAVFHPTLNRLSFLQEGIRLEFKTADNPSSALTYKGIVFNEMKGALASGTARLVERMNRELFPDITYGINSGGDPKEIPHLTYEELKAFHQKYYHPSQCLFFFYGNLPLEKHLDFIHEKVLKSAPKQPPIPPIPLQRHFKTCKKVEGSYPLAAEESLFEKTLISFGWVTCSIQDTLDTLGMMTLALLLMDNDASILKRALLDSGLCKQASAMIDNEITQFPFILTMHGCQKEGADGLEKVIFDTLRRAAKEGFAKEEVESALHQMEFARSEITGDSHPFGLSLFLRSGLIEQHGVAPEEGLLVHRVFNQLRERMEKEPTYFSSLLQKYLIDNPHSVRLIFTPSHQLESQEIDEEKAHLQKIESTLSEKEKKGLVKQAEELMRLHDEQEHQNLDILPKVTLHDVPKEGKKFSLKVRKAGSLLTYSHECFTNDVLYAELVYDLPQMPESELPYVRLLAHLLTQLGAGSRSFLETLRDEQAFTGGVWTALSLNQQASDPNIFTPSFCLKGKALSRNRKKFFSLLKDMASRLDFKDKDRVQELLQKHYTALASSMQQSALRYAMSLSASPLSAASRISNIWFGLDYYEFVKSIKDDLSQVVSRLESLYEKIFVSSSPVLVFGADEKTSQEALEQGFWGLSDLQSSAAVPTPWSLFTEPIIPQARVIASQVAFNATSFRTLPYTHPDTPFIAIASHLFDNLTLHRRVREQGGAYGSGTSLNTIGALFTFYSYRDPHISQTFKAFQEALDLVCEGDFEDSDLEEAILEMIQGLDSPVAPGSRVETAFGWLREGKTDALRQTFRERILSATRGDIIRATQKHLAPNYPSATPVVFAGKELLEKENPKLSNPLFIVAIN
jgi:hypothetical protein